MSNFWWSQVFAGISMALDILSFQFKSRKLVVLFLTIATTSFAVHYFLLGKNLVGFLVIISVLRFATSYFYQNNFVIGLFIFLNTINTIYFFNGYLDLIPYIGIMFITIATFQKNDKRLRQIMMPGSTLLVIYNLIISSPGGALVESVFLVSNVIGYYRHYYSKK